MKFGIPTIEDLYAPENEPNPEVVRQLQELNKEGEVVGTLLAALNPDNIPEKAKQKLREKAAMIGGLFAIAAGALWAYQTNDFSAQLNGPQTAEVARTISVVGSALGGGVVYGGLEAFADGYKRIMSWPEGQAKESAGQTSIEEDL